MNHNHLLMIYELMDDVKKLNKFCMTSREFREFEIELSEALEKSTPMMGRFIGWDNICPSCKYLMDESYKYCPDCGQKLVWPDA